MNKQKLIVINSKDKVKIDDQNSYYINLGDGYIQASNCEKILLKKFYVKYYNNCKKKFIKSLKKKIFDIKKKYPSAFELEIFNLRNDKIKEIDLIINILILKEIIKEKKIKNLCLITDDALTQHILNNTFKNIKNIGQKIKVKRNFTFLKISKFYIKVFFLLIFIKLFKKTEIFKKKNEEACISLAPIFYKNNVESFFKKKENLKINFLLTDETHLNFSLVEACNIYQNKYENLVHAETFIKFNDLFVGLMHSYKCLYQIRKLDMNFKIENNDFSIFYKKYFITSLINRLKLSIYDKAFLALIKKFKVSKFKMYLFEYCFGFYLINLIKKNLKNLEIIGYQHGIFSDKLFWFDIVDQNKYLPNKIISFNAQSFKDYKKIIKNDNVKFILVEKQVSKILTSLKISKKKGLNINLLILPGTHDANTVYENIKNKALDYKKFNEIFYIKFHPKKKISGPDLKNFKIISSLKNRKFHSVVISSTSTLVYDFMKSKFRFSVYDNDNKQNLISSSLQNKIKFYRN